MSRIRSILYHYGTAFFLMALIVFFSANTPTFLSWKNFSNIFRQISIVGICSVAMTMIIISGGIDLSVGASVALTGVILAKLMVSGVAVPTAIIIVIVLGTILGLFNGLLINKLSIPPMIATLGTMSVYRGLAFIITKGIAIHGFPEGFRVIGQGYLGIIPIPVIIQLFIYLLGAFVLYRMPLGRYIYGIGSNEKVSYLSGIDVKKVRYIIYTFGGFVCAIAGVVMLSRLNSGLPNTATGFELDVVTAVVLGGISIKGGEGRVEKSVLGCLIIGVLSSGMIQMGIPEFYQMLAKGTVLVSAVGFDAIMRRNMVNL